MKKEKKLLFFYVIFLLIFSISSIVVSECWIDLTEESPTCGVLSGNNLPNPIVSVIAYDSEGNIIEDSDEEKPAEFLVRFSVPGFWKSERNEENEEYSSLFGSGLVPYNEEIGKPEVPKKVIIMEIPSGTEPEVSLASINEILYSDINLLPVQPPNYDSTGADNPPFQKDDIAYATDAYYPANTILSSNIDNIRNYRYLTIEVTPVKYNPVRQEALMAREIVCHVNLHHSTNQETFADPALRAYEFDKILGKTDGNEWMSYKAPLYIIIMNDQFIGNALLDEFIEWKRRKGNVVRIVSTSEIATGGQYATAEDIKSFLESLPADEYPVYLLLIGDSRPETGVVTYIHSGTPTDFFYSCKSKPLGQSGGMSDLFMGRLPAEDNEELTTMLVKIIYMDRTPPENSTDYYNTVLTTGVMYPYLLPNSTQYQDASLYTETIDALACYFEQNYECFRVIESNNAGINVNDICYWDTQGPILWKGATGDDAQMGTRVLANIYKDIYVGGTDNVKQIIHNNLNNGSVMYHYRGHGYEAGFEQPSFRSDDVLSLDNGDRLPLIIGTTCSIASSYHTSQNNFARRWLNKPLGVNNSINGGGYAVIGATRQTNTTHNNYYSYGLFGAFINDFFSWFNTSTNPNWTSDLPLPDPEANYFKLETGKAQKLGQMFFFGNAYLRTIFGPLMGENLQYHLFGDPEAEVIFHEPLDITVSVTPPSIPSVATTEITVFTGEDGLQVGLYNTGLPSNRRPMRRISHNGKAIFNVWTGVYDNIEKLYITVTGFGKRPYEETIDILPDWGPSDLYIRDKSINQNSYMIALGNIFVGSNVFVESPADVTFTAGTSVTFISEPGKPSVFRADKGAKFRAFISEF